MEQYTAYLIKPRYRSTKDSVLLDDVTLELIGLHMRYVSTPSANHYTPTHPETVPFCLPQLRTT